MLYAVFVTEYERERHARARFPLSLLASDSGDHAVEVNMLGMDTIAFTFDSIVFRSPSLSGRSVEELRAIADQLVARPGFRLDQIRVEEAFRADSGGSDRVRLRPPAHLLAECQHRYYEAILGDGALTLHRYEAAPGQPRRVVPTSMTLENFSALESAVFQVIEAGVVMR